MEKMRYNLPLPTSVLSLTLARVWGFIQCPLSGMRLPPTCSLQPQQTSPLRGTGLVTSVPRADAWADERAGEKELELCFPQHQSTPRWPRSSRPQMSLECGPRGTYLRDADTVGLIMKRGRVVIHVPDLDVHLPCNHLARQAWGVNVRLSLWPLSTRKAQGPCLPGQQGPRGTLTPWWSLTENSTVNSDWV